MWREYLKKRKKREWGKGRKGRGRKREEGGGRNDFPFQCQ
jgi:hypothetical protein